MGAILRSIPPASPAVSLATAKAHLRVDHTADDDLITRLLLGACEDAGRECGTGVGAATYTLVLDEFPGPNVPAALLPDYRAVPWGHRLRATEAVIDLGVSPVTAVSAFTYYDESGTLVTLTGADYWLAGPAGRVAPAAGYWPATQPGRPGAVSLTFTAGTTPAPQIVDAVLLIVGDRYAHRGDGDGRKGIPEAARRLLWQVHAGGVV